MNNIVSYWWLLLILGVISFLISFCSLRVSLYFLEKEHFVLILFLFIFSLFSLITSSILCFLGILASIASLIFLIF